MFTKSRAAVLLAVSLVSAMVLSACSSSTPKTPSNNGPVKGALPESLTIADTGDLQTLDATLRSVTNHRRVYGNIYETLATRNPKTQEITPLLAEKWEKKDDKTWVFNIRKNVKFHNGDPMTAADVKFSLDRARDPKISQAAATVKLGGVEIVDEFTVKITTANPDPLLLTRVADVGFIASKKYYDQVGEEKFGLTPIGTGPYKFIDWVKGSHIGLAATDSYWGGAVPIKKLTFKFVPDPSTRVAALLAGEADIAAEIPPELGPRIDSSPTAGISSQVDPMAIGIWLKPLKAPLNNKLVRQAMNYAVDKEAIVKTVWSGRATVLGSPLFKGIFGYDESVKPYPYDPEKAKALLKEAGYPNGFTFQADVPIGGVPMAKLAAEAVAGDLAKVGIKMEMKPIEWAAFLKNIFTPKSEGTLESSIMYIKTPNFDGDGIMSPTFPCDQVYPAGWNWGVYCNPEVDALIKTQATSMDPKVREDALKKASQIIHDDAPWIFLYAPTQQFGVKKGLGWSTRMDGMTFIWHDLKA